MLIIQSRKPVSTAVSPMCRQKVRLYAKTELRQTMPGMEEKMREEFSVFVEGKKEFAVCSDSEEELLAAKAEGKAVFGFWDSRQPEKAPFGIPCLVERREDITEEFLDHLVRRHRKLPWEIAQTRRLLLREFCPEDFIPLQAVLDQEEHSCFSTNAQFLAYLEHQYSFYEYGLWAVLEKGTKNLIGAAGIWNGYGEEGFIEIGYWIHPLFRRKGYGSEAVRAVLDYAEKKNIGPVYAKIREDNESSRKLAQKLGFQFVFSEDYTNRPVKEDPKQTEARKLWYRYAACC